MNPFKAIKTYFQKKENNWTEKLYKLGFNKIDFPIIIKDGADLNVVYKLKDFGIDPDLYYHEFDEKTELIDSKGKLWNWNYDNLNKANIPEKLKGTLNLDEVKNIISDYFKNTKIEKEIYEKTNTVSTIEELIGAIADKL